MVISLSACQKSKEEATEPDDLEEEEWFEKGLVHLDEQEYKKAVKAFSNAGFPMTVQPDTMKNTMLRIRC